jgi:CubicO group peptidase (beta-lactamase class C family)
MMKTHWSTRSILWGLAALSWSGPLAAQQAYGSAPDSVRRLVADFREAHGIPGLAVAVARNGQVEWAEGYGVADLETGVPVTTNTRFRIGPISMSLTSALVGHLLEEHRLDLDADVHRYVPDFPKKRYRVTVRQLAGHLGGIRHWVGEEYRNTRAYTSVTEALTMFARDTLIFEPGTRQSFSVLGYTLLSAALESAGGDDYLTLMQQDVFDPLGLTGTSADWADRAVPDRAAFYEVVDGEVRTAPAVNNSHKWAGAGLVSTPADLVQFGVALCSDEYLEIETVETLWKSMKTDDGVKTGYGVGWMVGWDEHERRVVSHTGSPVGARAMLLVYPDDCSAVAIAANLAGVQFGSLAQEVLAHFGR